MKQFGNKKNLKVALVHDFLVQYGGAERVLEVLAEMFPQAPIYTLLYDKEKMKGHLVDREIKTSFLQKFPQWLKKRRRYLLPFMLTAPETFDLRDFDLVISSSGAWSKGIVTRLDTLHISYLHSPMRFVWDYHEKYLEDIKQKMGICKRMFLTYLRIWDFEAAQRPDILVANSNYTKERIKKYYRRDCEVIYPATLVLNQKNIKTLKQDETNDYFLIVSRLAQYKKIDLVVETFNKLELPLIIIGEGEQEKKIRKIAKKNIKILGWQDDKVLANYYQNARALIFPTVDDFGLTMVEAMSFGKPVIAIDEGGAREIVVAGVNGEFFAAQTVEVLADGVRRFIKNEAQYETKNIQELAEKFTVDIFKEKLGRLIENELTKQ
ncbi:MAG: glycosyltransferase [Candidatus Moraniibacteriota bacterium]